jgi:gamma-glutamyltranspeptidase/glutathione hydrolase
VCAAAAELLRAGGNAYDAAIAAGFAATVVEPALTSLGGGGFLLTRRGDGQVILFDFFVDTPGRGLPERELEPHFLPVTVHFPASDQIFNVGLGSVAVPGNLRGFLHAHRRLGRLPLADVVAPAISLARDGVPLNASQAYFLHLLRPIMTLTEAGRKLYAPGGRYVGEGDRLANADLAQFLESLTREGEHEFYEGSVGRRIARDMAEGQGLLTETDLAAYTVVEREPLVQDYRGHRLLTNSPPSFGGSLVALSLALLESRALGSFRRAGLEHLGAIVAAMQEVDRLRDQGWLRPELLPEQERRLSAARIRHASGGTTHVSVCDDEGNAASMTISNGEGSGYVVPGTGIMLNNMMGEDDLHPDGFHASPPGQRVASMMSPSIVLRNGRLRLVLGSGGSKRIRTAMFQAISAVVDFGASVADAVESPRLHWDGECLQVEPGFDPDVVEALAHRYPVNLWPERNVYFGGVHAVAPDGQTGGDPRRGGSTLVVA